MDAEFNQKVIKSSLKGKIAPLKYCGDLNSSKKRMIMFIKKTSFNNLFLDFEINVFFYMNIII